MSREEALNWLDVIFELWTHYDTLVRELRVLDQRERQDFLLTV
jgi:hypothetical protein